MRECKDCGCTTENFRCVECHKAFKHKIYLRNKDKQLQRQKDKRENNPQPYKDYAKDYYNNNKDKCNEACKSYKKRKRKEDVMFKIKENLRSNVGRVFRDKNITKKSKTFDILGCSVEEFKKHIENQFEDWMTWDNYGVDKRRKVLPKQTWDIDHIIPISTATTEEEALKLNHYTNFQPLCSFENRFIKKGLI